MARNSGGLLVTADPSQRPRRDVGVISETRTGPKPADYCAQDCLLGLLQPSPRPHFVACSLTFMDSDACSILKINKNRLTKQIKNTQPDAGREAGILIYHAVCKEGS